MKQTLFLVVLTLFGAFGVFVTPFCGVAVYYFYAVLRPQFIWKWALPQGISWSLYVAVPTIAAALLYLMTNGNKHSSSEGERPVFSSAHAMFLMFALWVAASYVTAGDQEAAWPWLIEYLKIFTMFFAASTLISSIRHVWLLTLTAALALGYIAYEVNFMYLTAGYLGIYHNGYGGLDNNGAGLMLAMGVPLCLFIYLGTRKIWRWLFAAFVPMLLHAVLMTYSRGAMVALLLAAPIFFIRAKHRRQLAIAAVALAFVIPVLAGPEIRQEFFSVESYQRDNSAQSRFKSWAAGLQMGLDYPILGMGIRNSNLAAYAYGADRQGRTIHNQFIQILADSGFPALIFYLLTFASVMWSLRGVRRWAIVQPGEVGDSAYAIACGVEGALMVFCIGSMFLSLEVFELPYLMLLLGAQLALVCRSSSQHTTVVMTALAPPPVTPAEAASGF